MEGLKILNADEEISPLRASIEQFILSPKTRNYKDCSEYEKRNLIQEINNQIDKIISVIKKGDEFPEAEINLLDSTMKCLEIPLSKSNEILERITLNENNELSEMQ